MMIYTSPLTSKVYQIVETSHTRNAWDSEGNLTPYVQSVFDIYYNGQKVFDTGCVGGSQMVDLQLNGFGGNVTIIVDPNCEGTSSTKCSIKLICPTN